MISNEAEFEPDWDTPLTLSLSPAHIIHALFITARSAHTGHDSCIDPELVLSEVVAIDDSNGNHCRLVEQEFWVEEEQRDWHDWSVELRLGRIYVVGHWQIAQDGSPAEWDWCVEQAGKTFEKACVLLGKRVRRGLAVEDLVPTVPMPNQKHH